MRVHLVGGLGSIGSLVSCSMKQAGWSPICLVRTTCHPPCATITLHQPGSTLHSLVPLESSQTSDPISVLMIITKSYSTLSAFYSLQHRITPSTRLILFQNGVLDTADHVYQQCPLFSPNNTYLASTTLGAYRLSDSSSFHVQVQLNGSQGLTWLGRDPRARYGKGHKEDPLITAFQSLSLLNVVTPDSNDFLQHLLVKVAINACINPWTVLLKCRNGGLLENTEAMKQIQEMCQEIELLYSHKRVIVDSLFNHIVHVIQLTRDNYSSMYQDVHVYHQSTEVDAILGYLLNMASQLGVECNKIRGLYQRVQQVIQENQSTQL